MAVQLVPFQNKKTATFYLFFISVYAMCFFLHLCSVYSSMLRLIMMKLLSSLLT